MKSIIEASVMTNFNLSDNQKIVLIRAMNAHSPEAAFADTATNNKEVSARLTLVHAEMLSMTDNTVELTELGNQLMVDEGLVDEAGGLTTAAQELVGDETTQPASEEQPPMEQFDLLSQINNSSKTQECDD